MKNANLIAAEFAALLPSGERPETTSDYEGFYHLTEIESTVEEGQLIYILRDHDGKKLEQKKETVLRAAEWLNAKYGADTVRVTITDSYRNMKEKIEPHWHLIDNAYWAVREVGGEPISVPVRGGTDGARLSFMGLPCPNLGTGSPNHHSTLEFASVQAMDKSLTF